MKSLFWIVLLAVASLAALFLLGEDRGRPVAPVPGAEEHDAGRRTEELTPVSGERAAAPEAPAGPSRVTGGERAEEDAGTDRGAVPAERVVVRGEVQRVDGRPVTGVEVFGGGGAALGRTDAAGHFELRLAPPVTDTDLVAQGEGWIPVRSSSLDEWTADRRHLIVVARSVALAGRVVDEVGEPVAGAHVGVRVDDAQLSAIRLPLDLARRVHFRTQADGEGRFSLDAAPTFPDARLSASAEGHEPGWVPVPASPARDLVIEITRTDEEEAPTLTGIVLKPDLRPAAGASVHYAAESTTADEAGGFSLSLERVWQDDPDLPLVAALEGFGPGVVPRFGEIVNADDGRRTWDARIVLADTTHSLRGSVESAAGEPLALWQVSLAEATEVTRGQVPPRFAEELAGGRIDAVTGADGEFVLTGLLPRDYRVKAYDTRTLLQVVSDPVPAGGPPVTLVVADDLLHECVEGRVESRDGLPVAGARVSTRLVLRRSGGARSFTSTEPAVTGEDGRFVLEEVPREHVHLTVAGEDVVAGEFELPDDPRAEGLLLVVARRCHFRVTVEGADLDGLEVGLFDAEDRPQSIHSFGAAMRATFRQKPLEDGAMPVCAASEDASTLVLLRRGEEVQRRPIALIPGEVTEIHLTLP